MEDPDYAHKYAHHTDNVGKTIKQAVDARHLRKKGGLYGSVSGRGEEPFAMGGEIGGFYYPNPYLEERIGLAGLIYESDAPVSGGLLIGARAQTPTRLAPFAGAGVYAGFTPSFESTNDGIDNNTNGIVDEEAEAESEFVGALVPEVGCHYWVTPAWRLTGSVSYYVTSSGPDNNFTMINVSLAKLTSLGDATSRSTIVKRAQDKGWEVGDGVGYGNPTISQYVPSLDTSFDNLQALPPVTGTAETVSYERTSDAPVVSAYEELIETTPGGTEPPK